MIDITTLTISEAHERLAKRDFSALELSEACLSMVEEKDSHISAYLEVFEDALVQAKESDKQIERGEASTLTGIPLAIKDNIVIQGRVSTAGSKILVGHISPYDAFVVEKLKKEKVIFMGRTNMDEFAMGSSTENSAYGPTKNPHDLSRVPGGSSGGSAAALSAGLCLGALGSETGGSIRQPASFCGVVGLKPTYGTVSRRGLIALSSSLDQIGPFGKTIKDTKILFDAISGADKKDSTSVPDSFRKGEKITGKCIVGVPRDFLTGGGMDDVVQKNFEKSLEKLKSFGCEIRDITLPNAKYSLAVYYILMPAEASSNLARFDGIRYGAIEEGDTLLEVYKKTRGSGFGAEPRRRIMLGTYVLSAGYYDAYYNAAVHLQQKIRENFAQAFENVHLIATPTTPTPAFSLGERVADPLSMYLADIFTVPANISGMPALSIPSGFAEIKQKKLPLGLQLMAPHFCEERLFSIGEKFEISLEN